MSFGSPSFGNSSSLKPSYAREIDPYQYLTSLDMDNPVSISLKTNKELIFEIPIQFSRNNRKVDNDLLYTAHLKRKATIGDIKELISEHYRYSTNQIVIQGGIKRRMEEDEYKIHRHTSRTRLPDVNESGLKSTTMAEKYLQLFCVIILG